MGRFVGIGPEAANLLGYLASIGTLLVLERAVGSQAVQMGWKWQKGDWRPVWEVEGIHEQGELVDVVFQQLKVDGEPPGCSMLGKDLPVAPELFREFAREVADVSGPSKRRAADFAVAFGCEVTVERDKKKIQDTALRTMSGAGHQHFLGSMAELHQSCTRDDIEVALFRPWEYRDGRPSMRWDPLDDRRYAYRADDPAKSKVYPIRTVRGANRLAIEALPAFPTAPMEGRLVTTGFIEQGRSQAGEGNPRRIRWPVWEVPVAAGVVRSLLTLPEIVAEPLDPESLVRRGIVEVYEAKRITEGRFRNFTPSRALLGIR